MKAPTMKDSRGNNSASLFVVITSFFVMMAMVLVPLFNGGEPVSVMDFGLGVTGLIAAFQVREYKQKDVDRGVQ